MVFSCSLKVGFEGGSPSSKLSGGAYISIEPSWTPSATTPWSTREDDVVYTTSSRSVALLAKGETLGEARERVYRDVPRIRGDLFYRGDIAAGV